MSNNLALQEFPIVHLHIPKTAGTAIRVAFLNKEAEGFSVSPLLTTENFNELVVGEYGYYGGHFGYPQARTISNGQIITVLRNPADRMVSTYYFWRTLYTQGIEVNQKTELAVKFNIDDFFGLTENPYLQEEFNNRMVWQLSRGSTLAERMNTRSHGVTDDVLLNEAWGNLNSFKVVGIQERMGAFVDELRSAFNIDVSVGSENVTPERRPLSGISRSTIKRIYEWCQLDLELYLQSVVKFG